MCCSNRPLRLGNIVRLLVLSTVLVAVGLGPICAVAATGGGPEDGNRRLIRDRLGIGEFESVALQTSRVNEREMNVSMRFGEEDYELVLHRYSARAPGFRLLVRQEGGRLVEVEPPEPGTYRGYVEGICGSRVTASQRDGLLEASVQLGAQREDTWVIKPMSRILPEEASGEYIIYRSDAVQGSGGTCAVVDEGYEGPLVEATGESGDTVDMDVFVCEIACEGDVEFYQLNGSSVDDTVADIEMIINSVSDIYELDAQVTFEITEIIVGTVEPGPYTVTDPYQLLGQFGDYWDMNHGDIDRDAVQLFTGKDLAGTALGIAHQDGLCWMEYSVVQSRYTTELVERVVLSAHEIGHLFDAGHCDYSDVWCRIMCSAMGGCSEGYRSFGPRSINHIRTSADDAFCLSAGMVDVPCTSVPFFDDFDYCGYYDDPDPARWTAADRINCHYKRIVLSIGRDYGGNMRFGTIRTWPMAVDGPATISYTVNKNYVSTGQYLKVEYFDSDLYEWHLLQAIPATTGQAGWASYEFEVPVEGYGDYFSLRFTGSGGVAGSGSWLIEDVGVTPVPCLSFDGDNDTDLGDLVVLAAAWLSMDGGPMWNADCDIGEPADGVIDIRDLSVFVGDWLCGK